MTESGQPPPGGYPPQPGGYPPQPGGYPPQPGGYPPQPGGYPPQPGYPQQPGYPPYGGGPGYGYGPPVVSSIPKVMGILMLAFGGIGVLGALVGIASGGGGFGMPQQNIPGDVMLKIQQFQRIGNLVGLPMAILQCFAGWWAFRYKSSAQMLANLYAGVAMIWVVISIVLMYSWLLPAMEKMMPGARGQEAKTIVGIALFVGAIFGMIWPALILILMNRKGAKEACVN